MVFVFQWNRVCLCSLLLSFNEISVRGKQSSLSPANIPPDGDLIPEYKSVVIDDIKAFEGSWRLSVEKSDTLDTLYRIVGISDAKRRIINRHRLVVEYALIRDSQAVTALYQTMHLPAKNTQSGTIKLDGKQYQFEEKLTGQWLTAAFYDGGVLYQRNVSLEKGINLYEVRAIIASHPSFVMGPILLSRLLMETPDQPPIVFNRYYTPTVYLSMDDYKMLKLKAEQQRKANATSITSSSPKTIVDFLHKDETMDLATTAEPPDSPTAPFLFTVPHGTQEQPSTASSSLSTSQLDEGPTLASVVTGTTSTSTTEDLEATLSSTTSYITSTESEDNGTFLALLSDPSVSSKRVDQSAEERTESIPVGEASSSHGRQTLTTTTASDQTTSGITATERPTTSGITTATPALPQTTSGLSNTFQQTTENVPTELSDTNLNVTDDRVEGRTTSPILDLEGETISLPYRTNEELLELYQAYLDMNRSAHPGGHHSSAERQKPQNGSNVAYYPIYNEPDRRTSSRPVANWLWNLTHRTNGRRQRE